MAWYAELKRRKWYCINGIDMIYIYRKKLYDDWYNSLTEEQKELLEKRRKEKEEKEHKEAIRALASLMSVFSLYRTDKF